jgi:DNA-binding NarL/FixJ family response regulator
MINLDPMQRGVMDMVANGMKTKEIAVQLAYSERSARKDVAEVIKKVGGKDRLDAIEIWKQSGLWCGVLKAEIRKIETGE